MNQNNLINTSTAQAFRQKYSTTVHTDVNSALGLYNDHFVKAYQFPALTNVNQLADMIDDPKDFLVKTLASGFADSDLKRGIFTIDRQTAANQIFESLQFKPLYDPEENRFDFKHTDHLKSPIHFMAYLRKRGTSSIIREFAQFLEIRGNEVVFLEQKFTEYCNENYSLIPKTEKEKEFMKWHSQYIASLEKLITLGLTVDEAIRPWGTLFMLEGKKLEPFPPVFTKLFR